MTTLWAFEIRTDLYQEITTGSKPLMVEALRLYLYRHNDATGTVRAEIRDASDVVIATSNVVNLDTVFNWSENSYPHGVINFEIKAGLIANTVYRIYIVPVSYSFSESAYLAWCNGFDFGQQLESYSATEGPYAALHLELWTRQRINRSTA